VWTIQEAALAPKARPFATRKTIVLCGKEYFPFDFMIQCLMDFSTFNALSGEYLVNQMVWSQYLLGHHFPRLAMDGNSLQLEVHTMMQRNRACGCFEPRDRVYGVYGMLIASGLHLPRPSYSKTVDEIFWEFTVAVCQQTKSIKLLELLSGIENKPNAPLWVPDYHGTWRVGDLIGRTPKATKDSGAIFQFLDNDKTLAVSGICVDIVQKASNLKTWQPENVGPQVQDDPLMNLEVGFEQTIRAFRDWSRILCEYGSMNQYEDYDKLMRAFGEVLVSGLEVTITKHGQKDSLDAGLLTWIGWISDFFDRDSCAEDLAVVKEMPHIKETFYDNPDLKHLTELEEWQALCVIKTHPSMAHVHHALWMLTRDKTFFVTKGGYMGTGTRAIADGDVVVLFAGVDRPMILREVDPDAGTWRVIGPAYISGMMEGELWDSMKDLRSFHLV
jgi:hypothetical protein